MLQTKITAHSKGTLHRDALCTHKYTQTCAQGHKHMHTHAHTHTHIHVQAFFEAGMAWREAKQDSMAFVMLNRFLDLCDAMDDPESTTAVGIVFVAVS